MRILLVEPAFHAFMHYDRWFYASSLAQLAAVAHEANHEVAVYDADRYFYKDLATRERSVLIEKQSLYHDNVDDFNHYIWQHLMRTLEDFKPDIVGVSVYTCKLKSAINTLKLVRQFNPSIKTCVGGAHVTAVPETFISEDCVDGVFVGHADMTFSRWIKEGCPRGIMRGDLSEIDPAKLPYPRRKALLFPEHYTSRDLSIVNTCLGCLGRCTFCSNTFMWSGKPKFRTSSSIRAELTELIEDWKIEKDISLGNLSFSDVPRESRRVAEILKDFGLRWNAAVRWAVTRDLLEDFIRCGCYQIRVGLESGTDKVLKFMRKGCSRKMIREKAQMFHSLGLEWHLFCITGFPIETVDDMEETLRFAQEIGPTSISLNSLSPLPGTGVYNNMPDMTPQFASTVNQLHPNHCFSKHMDLETYRNTFLKMITVLDDYNKKQKLKNGLKNG